MSNFSMDNIQRAVDSARNSGLNDFFFQEPTSNQGRSNRCGCAGNRTSRRRRTSRNQRPSNTRRCTCCVEGHSNSNRCTCRVLGQSNSNRCTSHNQRRTDRNRRTCNNQRPSNSNGCNQRGCGGVYRRNSW